MVAANLVAKDKSLDEKNIVEIDSALGLLKSAAIYGANASGKSNLAQAMEFMRRFMIDSSRETQSTDPVDVEIFRLSSETEKQPSYFRVSFLMDGKKFNYEFEVNRQRVISEKLTYVPKIRETSLFERKLDKITFSKKNHPPPLNC